MNIINQSKETFSPREVYKLTKEKSASLKDYVGVELNIQAWMIREDVNSKEEPVTVWSALLEDGTVVSTISDTFIRSFNDVLEVFGKEALPEIIVTSDVSSKGRTFLQLTIV